MDADQLTDGSQGERDNGDSAAVGAFWTQVLQSHSSDLSCGSSPDSWVEATPSSCSCWREGAMGFLIWRSWWQLWCQEAYTHPRCMGEQVWEGFYLTVEWLPPCPSKSTPEPCHTQNRNMGQSGTQWQEQGRLYDCFAKSNPFTSYQNKTRVSLPAKQPEEGTLTWPPTILERTRPGMWQRGCSTGPRAETFPEHMCLPASLLGTLQASWQQCQTPVLFATTRFHCAGNAPMVPPPFPLEVAELSLCTLTSVTGQFCNLNFTSRMMRKLL